MTCLLARRNGFQPILLCSVLLVCSSSARGLNNREAQDLSRVISFQLWRQGPLPRTLNDPVLKLLRRLDWQAQYRGSPSKGKRSHDDSLEFEENPDYKKRSLPASFADSTCLVGALSACDVRALRLRSFDIVSEPCKLLQMFQSCLAQETRSCSNPDPDVSLLSTSLHHLAIGLMANGHCLELEPIFMDAAIRKEKPEVCAPGPAWDCTMAFTDDLVVQDDTCEALMNFRDCLRAETRVCGYAGSRFLMNGVKGLGWAYSKSQICPDHYHQRL